MVDSYPMVVNPTSGAWAWVQNRDRVILINNYMATECWTIYSRN
ncbi:hypothetical protein P3T23_006180 [Paraburkholderia sp. GAS448]